VNTESRKIIAITNKSKREIPFQLNEQENSIDGFGVGSLTSKCIKFIPDSDFTLGPKQTMNVEVIFKPTKRIPLFQEDLLIRYAGLTRTLTSISGKAQGNENSVFK
jgi:hypothetical protein